MEEIAQDQTFVVRDDEIAAVMRDPQSERLGITRVSPAEMRTMLEAEGGAWLLPMEQMMTLSEKEVLGRVLLLGCDAGARYECPAPDQSFGAEKQTALSVLRARMQKAKNATQQEPQPTKGGKLANLPADLPMPASLHGEESVRNAQVEVLISKDKLSANVRLLPPKEGGRAMKEEELLWNIVQKGVRVGVDERFVERLVQYPIYGRSFHVAQGKPALHGQDGRIELYFEKDLKPHPFKDETGHVDFKEIDLIKNVTKGDILCEIVPPTQAIDGWDVEGTILPAKEGKRSSIVTGHNVGRSEDGRYLIALCDGQPIFKGGQIAVNETLTVQKVDNTTGNITFFGGVTVLGDVSSGFSINAGGDIQVKGFVENAELVAEGNVVLFKGMNGAGTGRIEAGMNVYSKFLEQVNVRNGQNVYGDVVLNCHIDCGGYIVISGAKGYMSGGFCRARKEIQVYTLGNEAELETRVEIRDGSGILDQIEQKQAQHAKLELFRKRIDGLVQTIRGSAFDLTSKRTALVRAIFIQVRVSAEIRRLGKEEDYARHQLQQSDVPGVVAAYRRMFPNVHLSINGINLRNTLMRSACAVRCRDGKLEFESSLPPMRTEKEG